MGIFDDTKDVRYALTCSTFCLVCIDGRSSMNLMFSVGVSLVVPSIDTHCLILHSVQL